MIMEWNDSLRLGIEKIDAQHKSLFDTVNELTECAKEGTGREKALETIGFLQTYVKIHFADEEALQKKIGFPGLARHQELHLRFTQVVRQLSDQAEAEGASYDVFMEVANAVNTWLISHIKGEDQKIAQYMRETGQTEG